MIYFDAAATTLQKPPEVALAVASAIETCASPGRGGYPAANAAAERVFETRELVSELFSCDPEQVSFTLNATHALNIAIGSVVRPGARVVISGFEHNAVMRPLYALGAKIITADRHLFAPERTLRGFAQAIRAGADAVICTHVSNVFGYVLPIQQIAELCRRAEVPLIVDASQSAGSLRLDQSALGAAFVAMPGHKGLYGPQGTGILISGQQAKPLLYGGTGSLSASYQMPDFLPDRLEAGTLNVAGISGLCEGLRFVRSRTPEHILAHERSLLARAKRGLEYLEGVECYTGDPACQSGVLSLSFAELDCELVAAALARRDVAVRAGLHCAPQAHESAHTLSCGTLRLSFSAFNTEAEVDEFVKLLRILVETDAERANLLAMEGI